MTKTELLNNEIVISKLSGEPSVIPANVMGVDIRVVIVNGIPLPARVFFIIAMNYASMESSTRLVKDEAAIKELDQYLMATWEEIGYQFPLLPEKLNWLDDYKRRMGLSSPPSPYQWVLGEMVPKYEAPVTSSGAFWNSKTVDLFPITMSVHEALRRHEAQEAQ